MTSPFGSRFSIKILSPPSPPSPKRVRLRVPLSSQRMHRRFLHPSCVKLGFQQVITNHTTNFTLHIIKREKQSQTTRKRPLWVFAPLFVIHRQKCQVLNCRHAADCLIKDTGCNHNVSRQQALVRVDEQLTRKTVRELGGDVAPERGAKIQDIPKII